MGGHIIIRSQIRDTLSDPLNQAALPTAKLQAVQSILNQPNDQWSDQDIGILMSAIEWLGCNFPNS